MPINKVTMWQFWVSLVHDKDGVQKQCKLLPKAGISTNNIYAFAAVFSGSLEVHPWTLVSSDILVTLFHFSPETDLNVKVMANSGHNHLQISLQIRADQSRLKPSMSTLLWFVTAHSQFLNPLKAQIWDAVISSSPSLLFRWFASLKVRSWAEELMSNTLSFL